MFFTTSFALKSTKCRILHFADDAEIANAISFLDDRLILQKALITFFKWYNVAGLAVNTNKCKLMKFHRTREFFKFDYCFDFFLF